MNEHVDIFRGLNFRQRIEPTQHNVAHAGLVEALEHSRQTWAMRDEVQRVAMTEFLSANVGHQQAAFLAIGRTHADELGTEISLPRHVHEASDERHQPHWIPADAPRHTFGVSYRSEPPQVKWFYAGEHQHVGIIVQHQSPAPRGNELIGNLRIRCLQCRNLLLVRRDTQIFCVALPRKGKRQIGARGAHFNKDGIIGPKRGAASIAPGC